MLDDAIHVWYMIVQGTVIWHFVDVRVRFWTRQKHVMSGFDICWSRSVTILLQDITAYMFSLQECTKLICRQFAICAVVVKCIYMRNKVIDTEIVCEYFVFIFFKSSIFSLLFIWYRILLIPKDIILWQNTIVFYVCFY